MTLKWTFRSHQGFLHDLFRCNGSEPPAHMRTGMCLFSPESTLLCTLRCALWYQSCPSGLCSLSSCSLHGLHSWGEPWGRAAARCTPPPPPTLKKCIFYFLLCFLLQGPSLWQHMQLHSDIPSFITASPPWLQPRPPLPVFKHTQKLFDCWWRAPCVHAYRSKPVSIFHTVWVSRFRRAWKHDGYEGLRLRIATVSQ